MLTLDTRHGEAWDDVNRELQRVVGAAAMADRYDRLTERFADGLIDAEDFRSLLRHRGIPVDLVLDQAITVLGECNEEQAERDHDARYGGGWEGGFAENH